MSTRCLNTVIIGAGPCGLGAASAFQRAGDDDWLLLEQAPYPGGLSTSFVDVHGFVWDIGGHVLFSHYDEFTQLMDDLLGPDDWLTHQRESWVRMLDRWIPYPFQNNIHRLPDLERDRCLDGLVACAAAGLPDSFTDFEQFILATTGRGIADLFMLPYNYKVWAYPPSKLAADWIGDRVSVPDVDRIRRNIAENEDDTGWGPNNCFRFPKQGGTGAIFRELAARLDANKVLLEVAVSGIDIDQKRVTLSNGETVAYEHLISTMPLDHLVRMIGRPEWTNAAEKLIYSSTHVIGVGLRGSTPAEMAGKCWMYFPESNCSFYRVTHFSHYSPQNVPDIDTSWSLMCEVSESRDTPVDRNTIVAKACDGLVNAGLIESRDEISHTWYHRVQHGYPTPSLHRDEALNVLLPALTEEGILSRGRFGAWKYEVGNMDHSVMQGIEAARYVLTGQEEMTVWHPRRVNGR